MLLSSPAGDGTRGIEGGKTQRNAKNHRRITLEVVFTAFILLYFCYSCYTFTLHVSPIDAVVPPSLPLLNQGIRGERQPPVVNNSMTTWTTNVDNAAIHHAAHHSLATIHNMNSGMKSGKPKATIAYLTSITACPSKERKNFLDAAAVLKHSIHLNSIRTPNSGSVYDYVMYATLHPEAASECAPSFRHLGYNVLIRDTPFNLTEIQNEGYVQRLTNPNAGCCQEKEFLKLYSYTMDEYPVVVHLDMDFIVLKPMDVLFDAFLEPDDATKTIPHAMWPEDRQWTGRIETMFTRDYPMGTVGRPVKMVGMQGGFWIVRPNQTAFDEMVALIRQGNFQAGWYDNSGEKMVKFPGFYGAAMIQGLVAFFYGHYHPGQVVELDRCVHNQMADDPWPKNKQGQCFAPVDGECRDCRKENVTDIYSAHFTFCWKPWTCTSKAAFAPKSEKVRLCLELHEQWHRARHDFEEQLGIAKPFETGDMYYGNCPRLRYRPMELELPS